MNNEEYSIPEKFKSSLVSVVCENFKGFSTVEETENSLKELRELLRTLQVEAGEQYVQNKKTLEAATLLGKGKLQEIAKKAKEEGSQALVFDFELSASQVRNIQKITGLEVIDRCSVILEIFARHAQTKEAKLQIEISRLEYLLPRLSNLWTHLDRQKGGVGVRSGEGEKQIELDRRLIRRRIQTLKKQLQSVVVSRNEQRKKRANQAVTAALVGYTNAGKSTLMNRLCRVNVLSEDKLFATLDSTFRTLNPDTKPPMILIDTVGFISNLPASLVSGFKTTLESAIEADLLVIVCDLSDKNFKKHLEVTQDVLDELQLDTKDRLIVFNKIDKISDPMTLKMAKKLYPDSYLVSAENTDDVSELREYIINHFLEGQLTFDLFIPYSDGAAHSQVQARTNILTEKHHEKGIFYRIKIPDFIFHSLGLHQYVLSKDDPEYSNLVG